MSKAVEKSIHILAIESSCDDTSVSVLRAEYGDEIPKPLSLSVQSQDEVHRLYGGIVPELASRRHLQNISSCLEKALKESRISLEEIDAFAATSEPGLIGSLLVGQTAAKTLSFLYSRPFISCNHLESHLMSVFLGRAPEFPYLSLLVSGGHTSLYVVRGYDEFELVGWAIDDAAGEAFDKSAKMMGLGFPGGPEIDRLAKGKKLGTYSLPSIQTEDLTFSFSGIKAEMKRLIDRLGEQIDAPSLCADFQEAVLNHITEKLLFALKKYNLRRIAIVGGVARNSRLRDLLEQWKIEGQYLDELYAPPLQYCTDNAAMVGVLAYRKYLRREFSSLESDVGSTSRPAIKRKARG